MARSMQGDSEVIFKDLVLIKDYIRESPLDRYVKPFYNLQLMWKAKNRYKAAVSDLQKYLDYGGGVRYGDQTEVEQMIRDLRAKL